MVLFVGVMVCLEANWNACRKRERKNPLKGNIRNVFLGGDVEAGFDGPDCREHRHHYVHTNIFASGTRPLLLLLGDLQFSARCECSSIFFSACRWG